MALGRHGAPEDIANALPLFAIAKAQTITGSTLHCGLTGGPDMVLAANAGSIGRIGLTLEAAANVLAHHTCVALSCHL
jgi:hypothetical protein